MRFHKNLKLEIQKETLRKEPERNEIIFSKDRTALSSS